MGKLSSSMRSIISPSNLIRNPHDIPTASPSKPHYLIKKKPTKNSLKTKESKDPVSCDHTVFDSPELSAAKATMNSLVKTDQLDPRYHNYLLQSYAAIATPPDSVSLYQHMIKNLSNFSPDRSTYHILLSHSCKSPNADISSVHHCLNLMVGNGIQPNQATVDVAVRSLCSAGLHDEAIELVKELCTKNSPPDQFCYNFLIKNLCKCRALSTVYAFIDEMKSFNLKPDLVTYTILIDNVCNTKNLREAMRLVNILEECGFKPDCYVYNTIMKGYCMVNKGSEAIGVYNKMKEEGVEPDLITYNTLIFGLSKAGRVSEAKKFLKVMAEMGHFPDAITYTSLMNGMCREKDALGALSLLEEMESKGCLPNSCTYNTLLHGLCKHRLLDKGIELYKLMKEGDLKLETASYATFVRSLCREGRIAEAYEVFDYAVESKSLDGVAAYSTLVSTEYTQVAEEGQGTRTCCITAEKTKMESSTGVHSPVRSISLPSRLHPNSHKIETQLNNLKAYAAATISSNAEAIELGLFHLEELYNCLQELIQSPLTQQALRHHQNSNLVEEALDGSVSLLDVCSTARDLFLAAKEHFHDLHSVLRRKGGRSLGIECHIKSYIVFRKKMKKEIVKSFGKNRK